MFEALDSDTKERLRSKGILPSRRFMNRCLSGSVVVLLVVVASSSLGRYFTELSRTLGSLSISGESFSDAEKVLIGNARNTFLLFFLFPPFLLGMILVLIHLIWSRFLLLSDGNSFQPNRLRERVLRVLHSFPVRVLLLFQGVIFLVVVFSGMIFFVSQLTSQFGESLLVGGLDFTVWRYLGVISAVAFLFLSVVGFVLSRLYFGWAFGKK